jgi:hypothetical protein
VEFVHCGEDGRLQHSGAHVFAMLGEKLRYPAFAALLNLVAWSAEEPLAYCNSQTARTQAPSKVFLDVA